MIPHLIQCFFKWDETSKDANWQLVDARPVGPDGQYPSLIPFLFKEDKYTRIPGRAVTHWTIQEGVYLHCFNPPGTTQWVERDFVEELHKIKDWEYLIIGGSKMSYDTANCVVRIIKESRARHVRAKVTLGGPPQEHLVKVGDRGILQYGYIKWDGIDEPQSAWHLEEGKHWEFVYLNA